MRRSTCAIECDFLNTLTTNAGKGGGNVGGPEGQKHVRAKI
jgi:hypothetical protein